jgi:nucleoside-diphosphate-sugar epimerase
MHALVIGGTGFVGSHTVAAFAAAGYDVTVFGREEWDHPLTDREAIEFYVGDRTQPGDLREAGSDADVVIDCAAFHPEDVRTATDIFADVDAYVYVSSGAAYGEEVVPKREADTALCPCTPDQATDDGAESYGPRKAQGDRAVFEAAADGVNALSVRPSNVYGPRDHSGYVDYWVETVASSDRVLLPGDGSCLWHQAYVEDVASAIRLVAESGTPGEAYNVGDRTVKTLQEFVEGVANALGTEIEVVHAGKRELATVDLEPEEFPLYRDYPHVLCTDKIASLGWESTPFEAAIERTVSESLESDRDGGESGPAREDVEAVLSILDTI